MIRVAAYFVCAAMIACVDGKTPDCTTESSGCFPEDSGTPPIEASTDASDSGTADASDAGDASSVPDVAVD
jgi:hypothetical protein